MPSLLRTLIVDDERLARDELQRLLAPYDAVEVVGTAAEADEAEAAIATLTPDLLFLDVQMPGASGFDLLERLDAVPHVVFATAYDEYAIEAFEANALDYLVKPIEPQRLDEAIERVRARAAETAPRPVASDASQSGDPPTLTAEEQVFVRDGDRCWFVRLAEVRLFEAAGNYTRLYFDDETPLIDRSLRYLEQRLSPQTFFRASRQHILNLQWVEDVAPADGNKLQAVLADGHTVELSRRRAKAFENKMHL
jgi:two-component system LytT family response regulator